MSNRFKIYVLSAAIFVAVIVIYFFFFAPKWGIAISNETVWEHQLIVAETKNSSEFKYSETEIILPADYKVEALPKSKIIENKFGSYKTEVIVNDESTLTYKREFIINDGEFPKEDYSGFRNFYKEVSRQDNAKIALIKK